MAVTIDAIAASAAPAAGTTFTWTHVIGASSTLILITASGISAARFVSTITVGGVTATFRAKQTEVAGNNSIDTELWSLANPPTGSVTISVTWNANATAGGTSISFLGSDGTIGTPVTADTADVTVASAVGNLVYDTAAQDLSLTCASSSMTAGSGQTKQSEICSSALERIVDSTETGAASVTMTWTAGGNGTYTHIGVDVHATAAAGPVGGICL